LRRGGATDEDTHDYVEIDHHCYLGPDAVIETRDGVRIEDEAIFGPEVVISLRTTWLATPDLQSVNKP
jgi:acetyltransferase-like isoleucine patch superfamily enzyme